MTTSDKILTAWANLGRRKVRTALTSMGVVVGITTLVTMVSLVNGAQRQVNLQFQKIGLDQVTVKPPSSSGGGMDFFGLATKTRNITPKDLQRWRSWPEVEAVVPEVELPYGVRVGLTLKDQTRGVRVLGDQGPGRQLFGPQVKALAGDLEGASKAGHVVVSAGALKTWKLGAKDYKSLLGAPVQLVLRLPRGEKKSFSLTVAGISSEGSSVVRLAATDKMAMKSWWLGLPDVLEQDGYDSASLRAADVGQAQLLVKRLRTEKWQVQSIDAILDVANRIFAVITAMLGLVSSVALLVACIGIVNTMIMSIYERTREIGTLKALGASARDIRHLFMLEAGMIGLIGGVAGLAGSYVLGRVLNVLAHVMARRRDLPLPDELFIITPLLAGQTLLLALIIGALAGLYPANRAARLDPLVALRQE